MIPMGREPAPAFLFYVQDFLTDPAVLRMDLEEIGAYVKLLALAWREGSLPMDTGALAELVRASPVRFETKIWPAIGECFIPQDGRLVNPRLERERHEQRRRERARRDLREARTRNARAAAAARWGNGG